MTDNTQQKPQTAMVRHQPQALNPFSYEPNDFAEAHALSKMICRTEFVPKPLQNRPEAVTLVLMKGREMGITTMTALTHLFVLDGKVGMSAELLLARVMQATDVCEYFMLVESDSKKATYETKRKGHPKPVKMTWTMEQANTAGLSSRDRWRKSPAEMLRARCSAQLARAIYPDVTSGLSSLEELMDNAEPGPRAGFTAPPPAERLKVVPSAPVVEASAEAVELQPGEESINAETGEVTMAAPPPEEAAEASDEPKPYSAMGTEERIADWKRQFSKAPTMEVLQQMSVGLAKAETDGSPVRAALKDPYLARANELRKAAG